MKHIYHSHTIHCAHAKLTVKELIEKAIAENYETIGISEHAFSEHRILRFSLKDEAHAREYVAEVNKYREVYKDKIRVLCGFEVEIVDKFIGKPDIKFNKNLTTWEGVDYILWGFHNYNHDQQVFYHKPSKEQLTFMVDSMRECFESGAVKYLAHPDGFIEGNQGWDENTKWASEQIIDLAIKHDVILGLNINGAYQNRRYPSREFWTIVSDKKAKATLELDAHSLNPFKLENINKAKKLADDVGVELIEKIW